MTSPLPRRNENGLPLVLESKTEPFWSLPTYRMLTRLPGLAIGPVPVFLSSINRPDASFTLDREQNVSQHGRQHASYLVLLGLGSRRFCLALLVQTLSLAAAQLCVIGK